MKILVVTMQFPHFPAPGGQTRQFCLLREAAKEHEITVVTTGWPPNDQALTQLKELVHEVVVLPRKYPMLTQPDPAQLSVGQLLEETRKEVPFEVEKWQLRREIPEYLATVQEGTFDLIQVEHAEVAHWVNDLFPRTPKLLVLHNVNFLIYRRFFQITPLFSKAKIWAFAQWRNTKRYEATLGDKFDKFIAMSDNDRMLFLDIAPGADVTVVPNGVDTKYFAPADGDTEEDAIVYTGYMGWKPSVDAVVTFCKEVFPSLKSSYPGLKFYIVGKDPSEEVQRLAKDTSVIVTGFVDDVRPYLRRSKLVVVPLRVGGGTRLKILEAMSMGKAVVSTSVGAEGLALHDGEDIFLADSNSDIIEKCRVVLGTPSVREAMGKKARETAASSYSWGTIATALQNAYKQLEAGKDR